MKPRKQIHFCSRRTDWIYDNLQSLEGYISHEQKRAINCLLWEPITRTLWVYGASTVKDALSGGNCVG